MYGYFIDAKFCKEKGIEDTVDAANDIIQCLKALRIVTFAKTATFPENDEIELFYFAVRGLGGIVRTVGNRGIPSIKLKELEAKMGLKSACWISFDDVSREFACYAAVISTLKNGNRAAKMIISLLHSMS